MRDEQEAEDVVQDTFVKIWETKRDLITSPDIKFYLITAVRNNCISLLRKQKTAATYYSEEIPEPEPEPQLTQLQLSQDATERQRKITAALDSLPPKCKEVFLMAKMKDMSYKQIAEALDISVKTVENQMGKALRMLRENNTLIIAIILFLSIFVNMAKAVGVLLSVHVL